MRRNLYRKHLIVATLFALFFTSCARDDFDWLIGTPINVTASAEKPTTRSASNIQTTAFDASATLNAYYNITGGDAIGRTPTVLTAAAADANGKNRLTPDVQPYYPSSGTVDIMALYPKIEGKEVTSSTTTFTVESNQEAEIDYKKSDLMWAGTTEQGKTPEDVNLQFHHLMTKMTVSVTGQGVKVKKVSLTNIYLTATTAFSAASYSVTASGEKSETGIVVASAESPEVDNTLSGSVLFPNQTVDGNFIEVEVSYGSLDGTAFFSVNSKQFDPGCEYTADLVVGRQDIGFVTAITDWENNGQSIAVKPGSSAGLKITAIPDQPYDGTPQTPVLELKYFPNDELNTELGAALGTGYDLVLDKDYTAEYFNNTDQGNALVIITGKKSPDRTGTQELLANVINQISAMTSFKITAHTGELTYPSDANDHKKEVEYEYNTTVDNELNAHDGDGTITFTSSDPTLADVTASGTVTIRGASNTRTTRITATMAADGNYTAATAYYDLTVKPRSLKNHYIADNTGVVTVTMSTESFTYMDTDFKPAMVVQDKGRTLQENVHYTLSYANNHNVGTATITIRGMGNYSDADGDVITKTFTITRATPNLQLANTAVKLAKKHSFTRRAKTDYGTITWSSSPAGYVTIADGVVKANDDIAANDLPQEVTITATIAGGEGYNWEQVSKTYQLTVVESEWTYNYGSDSYQTWTCPLSGYYELEACGAKGANAAEFYGGRGARVGGMLYIQEGQVLYVYVGQAGRATTDRTKSNTFNGGGYYTGSTGDAATTKFASGGGATDFALKSGAWNSNDHLYSRILVAGGGGGALSWKNSNSDLSTGAGGIGGGEATLTRAKYAGEDGVGGEYPGKGGTLSAGGTSSGTGSGAGSFGTGGNYTGTVSGGCGGGGWFGGSAGSSTARYGAGGGGSSFVYNAENIQAATAAGFTYTLQYPTTNNYLDGNLEITPTSLVAGGGLDGNGQARITYKSAE